MLQSSPSTAFLVNFVAVRINGNIIGKPKIAINVRLPDAFDAMLLKRLKIMPMHALPSKIPINNMGKFPMAISKSPL
jgi:hypothetical protein